MLIPGFRFYPTDEELVMYHLQRKVLGKKLLQVIGEIYIYRYAPWDLPDRSLLRTGDLKWYFFCPIEKKFAGSVRRNRSTDLGCWTTSGKDRKVYHNSVVVGTIRTLIFYKGKSPNAERTDWVMYEYKLEGKEWAEKGIAQDMYVLCVIFNKDGLGPKNGAQYGAPFKEEDWDSDEEVELGDRHFSSIGAPTLALATQDNPSTSHVPFNCAPENMSVGQSTSCPLETLPPIHHIVVPDTNANAEASQIVAENDDIPEMLDMFLEESEFLAQKPENSDRVDSPVEGVQTDKCIDGNNFEDDLANLAVFGHPESNALPSGLPAAFYGDQTFPDDNSPYWGPTDLDVPLNCLSGLNSIVLQRVDSLVEGFQTDKCIDGNNFDNELANLAEFGQPESSALPGGLPAAFYGDQTFPDGNSHYLELTDLDVPLNCLSGLNSIGLQRVDSPVEGFQTDICIDGNDFDNDLANLAGFGQPESNAIPGGLPAALCGDQTFPDDNSLYLELRDLDVPLTCLSGLNSIGLQRVDSHVEGVQTDYCIDGNDVYGDLGDLANLAGFDQLESNAIPGGFPAAFYGDQTFPQDNSPYLELMDLDVPPNCLSGDSPMEGV